MVRASDHISVLAQLSSVIIVGIVSNNCDTISLHLFTQH
uniref:Uncharacterized protein n=1 Tax=Arundo donax TaxID=35708 RepID=A0A0A9FVN1_ARUDO